MLNIYFCRNLGVEFNNVAYKTNFGKLVDNVTLNGSLRLSRVPFFNFLLSDLGLENVLIRM